MAYSGDELSSYKVLTKDRHKKRRHSLGSNKLLSSKSNPKPQLSGSVAVDHSDGELTSTSGTLLSKFLRSKRKKKVAPQKLQTTSLTREGLFKGENIDILAKQKGEFVRVVSTVLNPQIHYKTLPITRSTTIFEVIVKLVGKYSQTEQNPHNFYITEVRESDQGSYSRVLQSSDQVFNIQSRWEDGTKCSFVLCKKESPTDTDDPFLANPLRVMVMSPSQTDSLADTPGFTGVVDVDVPSTPTSPNSYSAKTSFFDELVDFPTQQPIRNQLVVSPSELSSPEFSIETRNEEREVVEIADEFDISRMMLESIGDGIINKIPSDQNQQESVKSSIQSAPSPRRDKLQLRPLVYSPMQSAERQYPEYVFTPNPAQAFLRKTEVTVDRLFYGEDHDYPASITSHFPSPMKYESSLEVQPQYKSSASMYPSFLRNNMFHSAMDFGETIYNVFDATKDEGTDEPSPLLVRAVPAKPKLKRHHTFHVRRDHLQLQLQDEVPLFRDHLIHRAAQAIKQRHSVGVMPDGAAIKLRSSSSNNISQATHGSEIGTDLDALKQLKIRNVLSSYSSERSLPTTQVKPGHHFRVDSDSVVDMRDYPNYRDLRISRMISDSVLVQPATRRGIRNESETTASVRSEEETSCSSEGSNDQEVLYTFQSNLRPVTVLVQRSSVNHDASPPLVGVSQTKNSPPLTTTPTDHEDPSKPVRITKKWLSEV